MDTMQFNASSEIAHPNITFRNGDHVEVMRLTNNGIKVNPDVSVDEAARTVLEALDKYIRQMVANKDAEIARLKVMLAANTGDNTNG